MGRGVKLWNESERWIKKAIKWSEWCCKKANTIGYRICIYSSKHPMMHVWMCTYVCMPLSSTFRFRHFASKLEKGKRGGMGRTGHQHKHFHVMINVLFGKWNLVIICKYFVFYYFSLYMHIGLIELVHISVYVCAAAWPLRPKLLVQFILCTNALYTR